MPVLKCGEICGIDHKISDHYWLQKLYDNPQSISSTLGVFYIEDKKYDALRLVDDLHILLRTFTLPEGYYRILWETELTTILISILLDERSWDDQLTDNLQNVFYFSWMNGR